MTSEMAMCRGCGHFVRAIRCDGVLTPLVTACPECGGVEFKDVQTDTVVRSTEADGDG